LKVSTWVPLQPSVDLRVSRDVVFQDSHY
jgi:hypothetical protein